MSMFGNLMAKVFGPKHPATEAASATVASNEPVSAPGPMAGATTSVSAEATPTTTAPTPQGEPVDVTAILDDMAEKSDETLDWKKSIVDLMKLVGMDSSLTARKQLADELHYTGSKDDSAAMNIWLHKQVMTKFAESGGKIPDSLKH